MPIFSRIYESNAQNIPNKKVSLDLKNVPLIDVLLDIQKQTGVNFAYEKTQIEQFKPVTINVKDATIEEVLKTILKDTNSRIKLQVIILLSEAARNFYNEINSGKW